VSARKHPAGEAPEAPLRFEDHFRWFKVSGENPVLQVKSGEEWVTIQTVREP